MCEIGVMPMPTDFKYKDVFLKGRPQHERFDAFSIRHPKMDCGKRAKIFAPFDALRGFDFAIMTKEVLYEEKPELSREDERELNRCLETLQNMTWNSRIAKRNQIIVTATYYVPCKDRNHEAYGKRGQLRTITGICKYVDSDVTNSIRIDNTLISFSDLIRIDSPVFHLRTKSQEWSMECLEEDKDE